MDDLSRELDKLKRILDGIEKPDKLKLSVLSHITEKFSDEHTIGVGGSGIVYKGTLPSRQIIAVKKLFNINYVDDKIFEREVTTMMSVKHQHIVRFIGYCSNGETQLTKKQGQYIFAEERERLLCFEYISNGSLEHHIKDELRGLEWDKRFQIIRGICDGLRHLHKETRIIHLDLKPPNILLTHDFVPKIADFGISRSGDVTKTLAQRRAFSLGYCAPEYLFEGKMSFKSDIYSLGAIITEMVTGTRNNNPDIHMVCRRWRHRWRKSVKHTTLLRWQQQVTRCLELAQRCQNQNPPERPDIQDIISELEMVTSMDISGSCSISTVEQKKSFLDDMLGIEPLESHSIAEPNRQISHFIHLTNDTDDYIAFRIELLEEKVMTVVSATRPIMFSMRPSKDVVPRRSSCIVTITLETLEKPLHESYEAKLGVQSTRVDKYLPIEDITAEMFKEEPNKVVDAVDLMVTVRAQAVDPLPIVSNKKAPLTSRLQGIFTFRGFNPIRNLRKHKWYNIPGGPILDNSYNIKIFKKNELSPILKPSNIIGEGAFSTVYKGTVENYTVAVKKLKNYGAKNLIGKDIFANEVIVQSLVIHKNIVKLIGCCLEVDMPILVYEFVSKGNLDDMLHRRRIPLNLGQRLDIAAQSADGLAYMHSKTTTSICHGDVKPANILLDDNMVPKISDFGMSKLIAIDNQHTNFVIGDMSYMDPEYLRLGLLTNKSDVYSFGVVLLELLTRKKASSSDNNGLLRNFLNACREKRVIELVDPDIAVTENTEHLDNLVEMIKQCLDLDVDKRPEMRVVEENLRDLLRKYRSK